MSVPRTGQGKSRTHGKILEENLGKRAWFGDWNEVGLLWEQKGKRP